MVLVACRRIAAYSVATGSRFYHRWIASEFNHSDAASRRWEHIRSAESAKARRQTTEVFAEHF
eukprot:7832318-Karenia_brevis.AAC.1